METPVTIPKSSNQEKPLDLKQLGGTYSKIFEAFTSDKVDIKDKAKACSYAWDDLWNLALDFSWRELCERTKLFHAPPIFSWRSQDVIRGADLGFSAIVELLVRHVEIEQLRKERAEPSPPPLAPASQQFPAIPPLQVINALPIQEQKKVPLATKIRSTMSEVLEKRKEEEQDPRQILQPNTPVSTVLGHLTQLEPVWVGWLHWWPRTVLKLETARSPMLASRRANVEQVRAISILTKVGHYVMVGSGIIQGIKLDELNERETKMFIESLRTIQIEQKRPGGFHETPGLGSG